MVESTPSDDPMAAGAARDYDTISAMMAAAVQVFPGSFRGLHHQPDQMVRLLSLRFGGPRLRAAGESALRAKNLRRAPAVLRNVTVREKPRQGLWESVIRVDVREEVLTIPAREILTADNVSVRTSIALRFCVADPARAVNRLASFRDALHQAAQIAEKNSGNTVAYVSPEDLPKPGKLSGKGKGEPA
jgi:hypothetical protein